MMQENIQLRIYGKTYEHMDRQQTQLTFPTWVWAHLCSPQQ